MDVKNEKTNALRLLDGAKIDYKVYNLHISEAISGTEVAKRLNFPENKVFKTLVTKGKSNNHYVFVIPSDKELDLKKCAAAVKEKSVEMIKQKELLPLTGYVHGGCSPIGMKKKFRTFFDKSVLSFESVVFSAGKIGLHVEIKTKDINPFLEAEFFDLSMIK